MAGSIKVLSKYRYERSSEKRYTIFIKGNRSDYKAAPFYISLNYLVRI